MGEIRKMVRICGVTPEGDLRKGSCDRVEALFDTGAATTVVSSRVAKESGVFMVNVPVTIRGATGRTVTGKTGLAVLSLANCGQRVVPVAVSDDVTEHAGAEIVLGHDYMQKVGMRLDMTERLAASCPRPARRRKAR